MPRPLSVTRDRVVGVDGDDDVVAVAGQRLVDRVVDHLEHQVVQAGAVGGVADVHAGALAHRLQAFEDLDRAFAVGCRWRGVRRRGLARRCQRCGSRLVRGHVWTRHCFAAIELSCELSRSGGRRVRHSTVRASCRCRIASPQAAQIRIGITTYLKPALLGHGDQRAGVGVLQLDLDHLLAHVGQRVDQVGDVEADLDGVAAVVDLELFLRPLPARRCSTRCAACPARC